MNAAKRAGNSRRKEQRVSRLEDHRRALGRAIEQLTQSALASALVCLVVGLAMTLPLLLASLAANSARLADNFIRPPSITLYLSEITSELEGLEVSDHLLTRAGVDQVRYVSQAEALIEFDDFSGLGFLVQSLPTNPLPASIIVSSHLQGEELAALAQTLEDLAPVDSVQLDSAWFQRLQSINLLIQRVSLIIAGLMAASVVLIIGNIARTAIGSRQQESEVISLVGGTRDFIALPFLYTGLLYGLSGALVACLLQPLLSWGIYGSAEELLALYDSEFTLNLVFPSLLVLTLCAGSGLGWIGAYLATRLQFRTLGI